MDRRKFLLAAATAGATQVIPAAVAQRAQSQNVPAPPGPETILAGYTLAQLRDIYHRDLFDDWLPFMEKHVVDPEFGGFLCNTDIDGTHINTNKDALFEGRGIWVYSSLYRHFGKNPRHLEIAHRSVELLEKSAPADDGFWCTTLHRDGTPASAPSTIIPTDLAIAEGFAAYAQATGRQEFLDRARRLVRKCVEAYDRPDYNPGVGHAYFGATAPAFPGARIMGSWMILLRAASQILDAQYDADADHLARRCADAVVRHHFAPEFRLNLELLNHDFSHPANEYAELCNLGNTLEITSMLLDEATRQHDGAMWQLVAERFQRHAEVAWDSVYGGAFHALLNIDENRYELNKLLWAQEEWLVDALTIYAHTSAPWAAALFGRMYGYVREKFPLRAHRSPLWMYATGRKATFEEFAALPKRVENYHHPRHLMRNLRQLEQGIAQVQVPKRH